jgi:hypothetical protein
MEFACKEVLEGSSWPAERAPCQSATTSGQTPAGAAVFVGASAAACEWRAVDAALRAASRKIFGNKDAASLLGSGGRINAALAEV